MGRVYRRVILDVIGSWVHAELTNRLLIERQISLLALVD